MSYIIGIENTGFREGRDSHGSHCRIQPGASRFSLSFRRRARAAPREIHRLRGRAFSGEYRRRRHALFLSRCLPSGAHGLELLRRRGGGPFRRAGHDLSRHTGPLLSPLKLTNGSAAVIMYKLSMQKSFQAADFQRGDI